MLSSRSSKYSLEVNTISLRLSVPATQPRGLFHREWGLSKLQLSQFGLRQIRPVAGGQVGNMGSAKGHNWESNRPMLKQTEI